MRRFFGTTVFTVEGEPYFWDDVVLAAALSGAWCNLERELRCGLACLRYASEQGSLPAKHEIDAAASGFRYEHDLVSADETTAWLRRWRLTTDEWFAYFTRALVRGRCAREVDAVLARYAVTDEELVHSLAAEAVCSGLLQRVSRELAERACVAASIDKQAEPAAPNGDEIAATNVAYAHSVGERLGLSPVRCRERLDTLIALESSYESFRARAITPKVIENEIAAHRLDWVSFHCRALAFADETAAREAALCVRADGLSLDAVASASRRTPRDWRFVLDELQPPMRERLVGAAVGDLLGPFTLGQECTVLQVVDREAPNVHDAEVRRRAEAGYLARAISHELARRVRWLKPL